MELCCDPDGTCMVCYDIPADDQVLICDRCESAWHIRCLARPLLKIPENQWYCPDCAPVPSDRRRRGRAPKRRCANVMVTKILAIQAKKRLSERQKAQLRQDLLSGLVPAKTAAEGPVQMMSDAVGSRRQGFRQSVRGRSLKSRLSCKTKSEEKELSTLSFLKQKLCCGFCLQLPKLPVSAPCGHNFCSNCLRKWVSNKRNKTCVQCRAIIPKSSIKQIRVNSSLAKITLLAQKELDARRSKARDISNSERPDKAFTSERAVRGGNSNASSGRILVTTHPHHYGPITKEFDRDRRRGVLVGDSWANRLECRQWGTHLPHVAAFAGQAGGGCQSVVLSTGYPDDEDHGDWFVLTGSGGHDLTGNKRTSKDLAFDQTFVRVNEAMREGCLKGYPVRVVRSFKSGSTFAPESGLRYDGIYRTEMCWCKKSTEGFQVCRYLFVRCDNEPPPWTKNGHGDKPRLRLPSVKELKGARSITRRRDQPSWGWEEKEGKWGWLGDNPNDVLSNKSTPSEKEPRFKERILKELECALCNKLMSAPTSTLCGHNFCKSCLEASFSKSMPWQHPRASSPVSLRTRKAMRCCPSCKANISDWGIPQVNWQLMDVITSLGGTHLASSNEGAEYSKLAELRTEECATAGRKVPPPILRVYQRRFQSRNPVNRPQPNIAYADGVIARPKLASSETDDTVCKRRIDREDNQVGLNHVGDTAAMYPEVGRGPLISGVSGHDTGSDQLKHPQNLQEGGPGSETPSKCLLLTDDFISDDVPDITMKSPYEPLLIEHISPQCPISDNQVGLTTAHPCSLCPALTGSHLIPVELPCKAPSGGISIGDEADSLGGLGIVLERSGVDFGSTRVRFSKSGVSGTKGEQVSQGKWLKGDYVSASAFTRKLRPRNKWGLASCLRPTTPEVRPGMSGSQVGNESCGEDCEEGGTGAPSIDEEAASKIFQGSASNDHEGSLPTQTGEIPKAPAILLERDNDTYLAISQGSASQYQGVLTASLPSQTGDIPRAPVIELDSDSDADHTSQKLNFEARNIKEEGMAGTLYGFGTKGDNVSSAMQLGPIVKMCTKEQPIILDSSEESDRTLQADSEPPDGKPCQRTINVLRQVMGKRKREKILQERSKRKLFREEKRRQEVGLQLTEAWPNFTPGNHEKGPTILVRIKEQDSWITAGLDTPRVKIEPAAETACWVEDLTSEIPCSAGRDKVGTKSVVPTVEREQRMGSDYVANGAGIAQACKYPRGIAVHPKDELAAETSTALNERNLTSAVRVEVESLGTDVGLEGPKEPGSELCRVEDPGTLGAPMNCQASLNQACTEFFGFMSSIMSRDQVDRNAEAERLVLLLKTLRQGASLT